MGGKYFLWVTVVQLLNLGKIWTGKSNQMALCHLSMSTIHMQQALFLSWAFECLMLDMWRLKEGVLQIFKTCYNNMSVRVFWELL